VVMASSASAVSKRALGVEASATLAITNQASALRAAGRPVIGFGAGVTAGSFLVHPEIERIVICEIEPLVPKAAGEHFASANYDVLNDPRVEVVYDDARHFIATTQEQFDIVTSDPIDPWMDGAAVLYSVEYYDLAKKRLRAGGIVSQWLPLYETDEPSAKSELASFLQVFPEGTVWSSHIPRNGGTDLVMISQVGAMKIDVDRVASTIARIAPSPTFLIADIPKRTRSPSTVKSSPEALTSGGSTSISISRHSLMYLASLSVFAFSVVSRAAMKCTG